MTNLPAKRESKEVEAQYRDIARARPERHFRTIMTSKGRKRILINPEITHKIIPRAPEQGKEKTSQIKVDKTNQMPAIHFRPKNAEIEAPITKHVGAEDMAREQALMYFYADWINRLAQWDYAKKQRYAKEVSEITSAIPLSNGNFEDPMDGKVLTGVIKEQKLKLFSYEDKKLWLLDEDGTKVKDLSHLSLVALLTYFVNELSGGDLEHREEYKYIKMAKAISGIISEAT